MMMRRMVVVLMGRRSYQNPTRVLGFPLLGFPCRALTWGFVDSR